MKCNTVLLLLLFISAPVPVGASWCNANPAHSRPLGCKSDHRGRGCNWQTYARPGRKTSYISLICSWEVGSTRGPQGKTELPRKIVRREGAIDWKSKKNELPFPKRLDLSCLGLVLFQEKWGQKWRNCSRAASGPCFSPVIPFSSSGKLWDSEMQNAKVSSGLQDYSTARCGCSHLGKNKSENFLSKILTSDRVASSSSPHTASHSLPAPLK